MSIVGEATIPYYVEDDKDVSLSDHRFPLLFVSGDPEYGFYELDTQVYDGDFRLGVRGARMLRDSLDAFLAAMAKDGEK